MHCADFFAERCRSCAWLDRPYPDQLSAKLAMAAKALPETTKWLTPVQSAESGFRNKAKMVVGGSSEAPVFGILQSDNSVLELAHCPLYPASIREAWPTIRSWLATLDIPPYDVKRGKGELKHVIVFDAATPGGDATQPPGLMLRLVLRSREALDRLRKRWPELAEAAPEIKVFSVNLQPDHKAILEGETEIIVSGNESLTVMVNAIPLQVRPQSFFQTNSAVGAALYRTATDWLSELQPLSILDLFCGVGGFALHAARALPRSKIYGVELADEAISAAQTSAQQLALKNTKFYVGDALETATDLPLTDCIIVNPPRRGLGAKLCTWLEESAAQHLIYSSCNLTTLAIDLTRLPSFSVKQARVLDMFAHTEHFEIIVLLQRD